MAAGEKNWIMAKAFLEKKFGQCFHLTEKNDRK
jgi:hypothetical protein